MKPADTARSARGTPRPSRASAGRRVRLASALLLLGYAAFSLATLPRYGPTWDVQMEFPKATAFVAHALGEETPSDVSPWHRISYQRAQASHFDSVNGCLPSLFAAATGKIFFEKLGVLGYIDAYHLGLTLLWLVFLVHFHWRVGALHGPRVALVATLLLALMPRLVGHSHNNMKDIPALAFGTSALLELAIAVTRNRPRQVWVASLLFACGVSSKFVAGIVILPAALLLWLAFRGAGWLPRIPRAFWLPLATVPLVSLAVLFGHWPYLWAVPPVLGERIASVLGVISTRGPRAPSLYPIAMALITTPLLVWLGAVLAALAGKLAPPARADERRLLTFYAAWVAIVLGTFSSGLIALFDGMRHFMLFLPPLTLLSAWGLLRGCDFAADRLARHGVAELWTRGTLAAAVLASSLAPIVLYHPYEVTYYNALVGGLPGATRIRFGPPVLGFTPGDYWGTSVRPAVEWANEHLPRGAGIWISLPPRFHRTLPLREDLVVAPPDRRKPGRPHYLVFLNRSTWFRADERDALRRGERVHQETSRGVPLAFVYRLAD